MRASVGFGRWRTISVALSRRSFNAFREIDLLSFFLAFGTAFFIVI